MRKNPMLWDDEAPQGVLSPREGLDETEAKLSLLGLPSGDGMISGRDVKAGAEAGPAVRSVLLRIADALRDAAERERNSWFTLDDLAPDDRAHLFDALGDGEVSMVISPGTPDEGEAQIWETVLPGVWLGHAADRTGRVQTFWVEIADAPGALRRAAVERPGLHLDMDRLVPPRGAMNVLGVLSEVRERSAAWTPGTETHVINFTLFPMTPADSAFLASTLGEVGVRVASGGYGAARVIMTAVPHVWAVQYLNGMQTVILDTLEIGDVPACVVAAREDFEDSAERLAEIREAYRS